ncbi:hypothetical protein FORC066_1919 [Yersinia enterocolitica]|nr:hypothetical protein FORC065_2568 [Yersinia enterocolitica]UXD29132.1 hypothetical protein FORC066_1919 [Yersinia enterocolitica]
MGSEYRTLFCLSQRLLVPIMYHQDALKPSLGLMYKMKTALIPEPKLSFS